MNAYDDNSRESPELQPHDGSDRHEQDRDGSEQSRHADYTLEFFAGAEGDERPEHLVEDRPSPRAGTTASSGSSPHGCTASEPLTAALAYASIGLQVLPITRPSSSSQSNAGKRPHVMGGCRAASVDHAQLRRWWKEFENANVGIATGGEHRLLVIDVDPRNGGTESWQRLIEGHADQAPTCTVVTSDDGRHYYLRYPENAAAPRSTSLPGYAGIDIKFEGGYVVAPPSSHASGHRYTWLDGKSPAELRIATAPAWLVDQITEAFSSPAGPVSAQQQKQVVPTGSFYPENWPESHGPCPACGHDGCFGMMPEDPTKWICFSSNHGPDSGDVGAQGAGCWFGDETDLLRAATVPATAASAQHVSRRAIEVHPGAVLYDSVAAALTDSDEVQLYERGGVLVELRCNGDTSALVPVAKPRLREIIQRSIQFVKRPTRVGARVTEVRPPSQVVDLLREDPAGRVPSIRAVVPHPVLLPDGRSIDTAGYDTESRTFVHLDGATWPRLPSKPTREDALAALERLLDVVCDFPFRDEHDRAAAVALMVTPIVRELIDGPCPIFCVKATVRGSGKTLLAKVSGVLVGGAEPAVSPWGMHETELSKKILAIAVEARPLYVIDNVSGSLASNTLAAAATTTKWSGRMLGETREVIIDLFTVFVVTGNNLEVEGDLNRRVVAVHLAPEEEFPEERQGFQHPDLIKWVKSNRERLVVDILTIFKWFLQAGRPQPPGLTPFGSFEEWSGIVRATLVELGLSDPCEGRLRLREEADPQRDRLAALFGAWATTLGKQQLTLRGVEIAAHTAPDLRDALAALHPRQDGTLLTPGQLAKELNGHLDRIVAGYRLVRPRKKRGTWLYQVIPASGSRPVAVPVRGCFGGDGGALSPSEEGGEEVGVEHEVHNQPNHNHKTRTGSDDQEKEVQQ